MVQRPKTEISERFVYSPIEGINFCQFHRGGFFFYHFSPPYIGSFEFFRLAKRSCRIITNQSSWDFLLCRTSRRYRAQIEMFPKCFVVPLNLYIPLLTQFLLFLTQRNNSES